MLPDGAIFCGECGRAVTAAANRRPVAPTPVEQAPPPPLQQPDLHGRRLDPAADAWLPEATLDPATRAWLTGADRRDEQPPAPVPVQRPDEHAPRSAPTHVHGADSGLAHPTGHQPAVPAPQPEDGSAEQVEPPLDPNAYPSETEDPDVTRLADRSALSEGSPFGDVQSAAAAHGEPAPEPAAPVWSPPQESAPAAAPAGPSWWVGRSNTATPAATEDDGAANDAVTDDAETADAPAGDAQPQPGDTAVVEPLVDRRPPRPAPLVTPGSQATTCHVCGHRLEPDDIFCGECGAVRPAVTAAFTGQIVPLPMDRPDWAADDSVQAVVDEVVDADDESPADATPDGPAVDVGAAEADPSAASDAGEAADSDPDGTPQADVAADPASAVPSEDDVLPDEDTPRTPRRPRGVHAAPFTDDTEDAEAERPAQGGSSDRPVPASPTLPSSAPVAEDTAAQRVPTAAPLPPLPGVTGPVLPLPRTSSGPSSSGQTNGPTSSGPTSADGDLEDDVEETRIVSGSPTQSPFVLHFSTGERFGVHGTGLVGRLPRPQPGERFDDLLTVHDPGKSVSKTHLEIGRDGDDLWVSDRFSGNGTVVRHIDGSIRRCEPGRRYRVERGARVDIGEQFFLVQ